MEKIKFNLDKCYVDKRKLVLDCDILLWDFEKKEPVYKNFVFTHDHWGHWDDNIVNTFIVDGEPYKDEMGHPGFSIIEAYKHRLLACFFVFDDFYVVIDRRYEHNKEFDVFFRGGAYLVEPIFGPGNEQIPE